MNKTERGDLQDILVDYIENPRKMGPCILQIESLFRQVHNRWCGYRNREEGIAKANDILNHTCQNHHVTLLEIRGKARSQILLKARMTIIMEMYDAGYSYSEIGRTINRHHSTITYILHKAGRLNNGT